MHGKYKCLYKHTHNQADISISLESSLILSSSKYPEKKTQLTLKFIKNAPLSLISMFIVTVKRSKGYKNGMYGYAAYDSSGSFILYSRVRLECRRYVVYGRLGEKGLEGINFKEVDYKEMCYQIL